MNINKDQYLNFNNKILKHIKQGMAVSATDVSVKDKQMRGSQIISNEQKQELASNTLFHNNQVDHIARIVEVIVLLDLITVLEKKGKHIIEDKIVIVFNNN